MTSRFSYRPALDGLRAVAVLAVIVYHVYEPWLPGGFLGVDVFFVLSGYLITSLLVIEHGSTGRIALSRFWSRRARRLIPAILILIIVVAAVENQTVAEAALRATRRNELLATLFYFANWFFVFTDVSYFADYAGASPVRHTWSLAIEEQFYMVFPLLMAGGFRLTRRRLVTLLVAVMGVSAVLMSALFDQTDPSRAYYGTDARIHQLLAGAILGLLLTGSFREVIIKATRRTLPVAAPILAAALFLVRDDGVLYYRGGAFVVGIVTCLVIGGLEHESVLRRGLVAGPMVAIGKISYGMYLWHFPVVIWLVRLNSPSPAVLLAATITLTIAIASLSFVLVERPIRVDQRLFRLPLTPRRLAVVVPLSSAVVALMVVIALPDALPDWARDNNQPADGPVAVVSPSTTAASTENGPETTLVDHQPITIAAVGDSFMVSAYPGFRSVATTQGLTFVEAAFPACPVGYEPLANLDGERHFKADQCIDLTTDAYSWLIENPADVVVWHDLQSVLPRFADEGSVLVPGTTEWRLDLLAEWRRVLDGFVSKGMTIVILEPPSRSQDVDCSSAESERRCNDIRSQDELIRQATRAFKDSTETMDDVFFLDLDELLCPGGIPCPSQIDGLVVREGGTDQTHFTEGGAIWFAEWVISEVVALVEA